MNPLYNEPPKEDLRVVAEDVEQLLEDAGADAGERNERLRQRLRAVRRRLERLQQDAADRLRRASAEGNRYVHENPWGVVGIAATVSFLLGMLSTPVASPKKVTPAMVVRVRRPCSGDAARR